MSREHKIVAAERKIQGNHGVYSVTLYTDGSMWCTCPAFRFAHAAVEKRTCKHAEQAFPTRPVEQKAPKRHKRVSRPAKADEEIKIDGRLRRLAQLKMVSK